MRGLIRLALALVHRLRREVASGLGRLVLYAQGVQVGRGVLLFGAPIVQRAGGSAITLGDRVVLCSLPHDTALGVAHAVVLRTLGPEARLEIGEDTGISGGSICAAGRVRIGARCLIGADVLIADTDFHPLAAAGRRHGADPGTIGAAGITIGDDVFIGARACILKGVTIGPGAVVGCAAVVTRDVAALTIVAGNPAREIGRVPEAPGAAAPALREAAAARVPRDLSGTTR
jgi:acetyltransferase-like isoleucine patch superfamily enzyme